MLVNINQNKETK